jgi:hypothetical protein
MVRKGGQKYYCDFDIYDVAARKWLLAEGNSDVYVGTPCVPKVLVNRSESVCAWMYPDEIVLVSSSGNLKVVRPRSGFCFSDIHCRDDNAFSVKQVSVDGNRESVITVVRLK